MKIKKNFREAIKLAKEEWEERVRTDGRVRNKSLV
jgi:hypothetical protein